uniref:ZZ-type domain-containing protein n=1 Tax=Panagrolaimus superbus TaxID=310955 RepID=A0A914XU38_9BILA
MSRFYDGFQPKHAARCDSCQTSPIFGSRYKCNECDNFDLCEECYSIDKFGVANTSHNEAHSVKMILSNLDEKAYSVHTQCCNGCKTPKYPGNRYKCKVCSDFNLCERCHGDDRFAPFDNENVSHINSHEMEVCTFSEQKHHNYEQWKGMTIKLQHHFGSQLGTRYWDKHNSNNPEEWKNLGKKIGHALYGPPTVIPTDILIFGYNSTVTLMIRSLKFVKIN